MENDFNFEDQEMTSLQTCIFNNDNSILPVIKNKKRNNKIFKTFCLSNNKNEMSLSRGVEHKKTIFKSPNRMMHQTYSSLVKNNKKIKFISPDLIRNKKYGIDKEKISNLKNTYNKTCSDNESLSKNSSSFKFFNIKNISSKNINIINNKIENKVNNLRKKNNRNKTLGNIINNNYSKTNKKKVTLELMPYNNKKFNTIKSMKNIKLPEEKLTKFQSDSSFLNSSDEEAEDNNDTNSLSNIQLEDLEKKISESNDENNNEEEYDKYSHFSNKIKNGQNIYLISPSRSTSQIKNSFKKSNIMSRTLSFYKSPIKKTISTVKFNNFQTDYNNKNKKYDIEIMRKKNHLNSHKNKLKNREKEIIILSEVFDDYHTIIRRYRRESSIIQRPFNININQYLENERKKIKNKSEISFERELKIKEKKEGFIENIVKKIKEKINYSIKENNENKNEKETFNKIIRNAFVYFYQQIIYKNWVKEIESSYLEKIIFTLIKKTIIPNLNYISNTFFDCFNFTVYYLLDGQYKEKKFNPRRSSIINNNLLILGKVKKTLKHSFKKKPSYKKLNFINHHFINIFPVKDFIQEIKKDDIILNEPFYHFIQSRKKTRRRKRVSIHDLIKRTNEKKKDNEEINKNIDKKELHYKKLLNKYFETNKLLDKWNFLRKKSIFKKNNEEKEEERLKKEYIKLKKQYLINLKWKQDMEILKSLGGDPVSKHCALLRTQEYEEENSNLKSFLTLLSLIDKNQNELFFETFRDLRYTEINHQEKYSGDTLLIRASKMNNINIVEFLLEKGCNINIQNRELNTALHYAYMYNRRELINILISHGSDVNIINKKGFTPWECMKN